ncbi:efflux RND transporter periplasmic adaptor subunit [Rhodopila globiformis]|nr:efflux RND transporter periplasmic adaptor subunit [Rhodopila globiformis]
MAAEQTGGKHADTVTMTPQQQQTIGLKTAKAETRAITEPIKVPGTIAFDPNHVAIVRPLAQGRVIRLLAQPGDAVKANQPLATLDVPTLVNQEEGLASAQASLQEAQAGVAVARDALRRGVILTREGSLSQAETERRRLVLAQAEATASVAQNRVRTLQTQIALLNPGKAPGLADLASPLGGTVVSVNVTPGELIDPTTNSFTVADLSVVVALAQVPEASATLVAVGDPAEVRLASGGSQVWNGKVAALSAQLDTRARTLPARIVLDNRDDTLRAGMFIEATITSNRGRDDVTIPVSAVQFLGKKQVAFTPIGGNRFQSHDLTLGVQQPDWVEVRSGLHAGDEVVTIGSFALKAMLQEAMTSGEH